MRDALLSFVVGLLITADGLGQGKEKAAKELQGSWVGLTAELSGKKGRLGADWEIKEDKIIETNAKRPGEWKYHLDPTKKNPRRST